MKKLLILTTIIIVLCWATVGSADMQTDLVIKSFDDYLSYMKEGQYDQASAQWLSDYIYEVYKFGIVYTNAPYKYDCNSHLTEHLDEYKQDQLEITYTAMPSMYDVYKILVRYDDKGGDENSEVEGEYYLMRGDDAGFYLAPNYWPLLPNMDTREGKYYKLYYNKEIQINDTALMHIDLLVDSMAENLQLSPQLLERLSMDKFNYFLCENANQIALYAGKYIPGWHDPAGDFIVTNYLPHGMPMADFLIKYKLSELPLYTLPFMEKGLAVYLGGRAGADLGVFGQMVKFSLESDFMKLEDILAADDFEEKTGGPDFGYTLSAYFIAYLTKEFGIDKVLDIYLQSSGDREFVDSCSINTVKGILEKQTGKTWYSLESGFGEYFKNVDFNIELVEDTDGSILYQSGTPEVSVTLYENGDFLILDAYSNNTGDTVNAAMLIGYPGATVTQNYRSSLFEKHFPEKQYDGQFYGLIFGPEELGVYNYLTNEIESKYITSLSNPDEMLDPAHITFRIPKKLLPGDFDQLTMEIIELP
ncbi:MAG: hypothetical protein GWO41_13420 [candidate division Zixibacteria bacterium]|nr:hypothetical protein [candidate division Zixibacteria bacterium]NIR63344.1 hypothetical protein [candidate division Zixibacteria bacterium]NIS17353.1 hypothetical protein [candidate division Zixibacteria bacterium]NIS45326.1 hypothetical protein [candidate division Zixibacteria bacterium]NIT53698.1 hypothetical protein [candidate division Zixibacteria bacterium]